MCFSPQWFTLHKPVLRNTAYAFAARAATFAYDTRGRMSGATSAIGGTTYQVNSLGERIRKTNSQGDTVYHYDSQGRLIAESSPAGQIQSVKGNGTRTMSPKL